MNTLEELITLAKERGYATYDELNAALDQLQMSSVQIEDAMARLQESGIRLVESEGQPTQLTTEQVCARTVQRLELALAALRNGKAEHASQLIKSALAELESHRQSG